MADRLTDADLDAIEADACHCHDSFKSAGMVDPDCPHEAILALVAEVRQARRLLTRALPHIDPNDNHDTYELMLAIEEATR